MANKLKDSTVAFVACYRALLALAKRKLADAKAENKRRGESDCWPKDMEWSDMVGSSHSIFMRQAREEAGVDHEWYNRELEKNEEHVASIYREAAGFNEDGSRKENHDD